MESKEGYNEKSEKKEWGCCMIPVGEFTVLFTIVVIPIVKKFDISTFFFFLN